MKPITLFTTMTGVVQLLCTALWLASSSVAMADAPAASPILSLAPADECADNKKRIYEGVSAMVSACGDGEDKNGQKKCIEDALKCKIKEKQMSSAINDSDTDQEACDSLDFGCESMDEGSNEDAKVDKKEARQRREDLEKEASDAQKNNMDQAKQAQDQSNQADDAAADADKEYAKNRKEITDKLQKDLADIDDAKLKAMKDAQEQYDKLDVEYIKMRDKLRRLDSDVSNLKLSWNVQCLANADAVASKYEEDFDKESKIEDAKIKNYQLTNAAGKKKRLLKQKRKKIVNKYNEALTKCNKGIIPPGAPLKLQLEAKKRELVDETKYSADAAARLEKLRLQILQSMKDLEKSLDSKNSMITQQAREAIELLDQNHNTDTVKAQQRKMQAMQQAMQQQAQTGQADASLKQRLEDARADEKNASTRALCGRSKGTLTGAKEKQKAVAKAKGDIDTFCMAATNALKPDKSRCMPEEETPPACKQIKAVITAQAQQKEKATSKDNQGFIQQLTQPKSPSGGSAKKVVH